MTKKRAYYVGFNGICATYCVFRRKSPILKKFLQCIILQPKYCRSYNMYTPLPNILQSFLHIYALLTPRSMCRQRSVASDSADGVSPLPYSASGKLPRPCSARAVAALPYSAKMRYYITLSVARPAVVVNNITMPRSVRRLCRATFYYLKQIARA